MPDTGNGAMSDPEDSREQDRFLPVANVARLMKRALPDNSKIAKEAKDCIMECVSEFISFITSEATDRCISEKRKTINGEDILWAMQSLGFDNYCETMKVYLHRYRESIKLDRAASLPPSKADSGVHGETGGGGHMDDQATAAANQAAIQQMAYAIAYHQQQQLFQQQHHHAATSGTEHVQQQRQQGQSQTQPQIALTPQQLNALAAHFATNQR
ncbi:hypothetical protein SpCBS45565_g06226 [Spizellomyces sp. 'palustris']|nr:hypothetical protein SpCBS45565_g06226 [Spizellomyces sp. 'palustris']